MTIVIFSMKNSSPLQTGKSRETSRRAQKKAKRRKEIYDCSIELFVRLGYENVTVDDIVETVDVAKGTFFNYFPSKSDVLVEYWRILADEVYTFGEKQQGDSGCALFRRYFRKLARCVCRDGEIFDILVYRAFGHPAEVAPEKEWAERRSALFQRYAKIGQECGEIPSQCDKKLIGDIIVDLWTGSLLEWVYSGKEFSLESRILKKLDLLFEGLGAASKISNK